MLESCKRQQSERLAHTHLAHATTAAARLQHLGYAASSSNKGSSRSRSRSRNRSRSRICSRSRSRICSRSRSITFTATTAMRLEQVGYAACGPRHQTHGSELRRESRDDAQAGYSDHRVDWSS